MNMKTIKELGNWLKENKGHSFWMTGKLPITKRDIMMNCQQTLKDVLELIDELSNDDTWWNYGSSFSPITGLDKLKAKIEGT